MEFNDMEYELSVEALWYRIEIMLCDIANDEELTEEIRKKLINAKIQEYIEELRYRVEHFKKIEEQLEDTKTEEDSELENDESDESDDTEAVHTFQKSLQLRKDLKWFLMELSTRYQKLYVKSKETADESLKQEQKMKLEKEKDKDIFTIGKILPILLFGALLMFIAPFTACYLKKMIL